MQWGPGWNTTSPRHRGHISFFQVAQSILNINLLANASKCSSKYGFISWDFVTNLIRHHYQGIYLAERQRRIQWYVSSSRSTDKTCLNFQVSFCKDSGNSFEHHVQTQPAHHLLLEAAGHQHTHRSDNGQDVTWGTVRKSSAVTNSLQRLPWAEAKHLPVRWGHEDETQLTPHRVSEACEDTERERGAVHLWESKEFHSHG